MEEYKTIRVGIDNANRKLRKWTRQGYRVVSESPMALGTRQITLVRGFPDPPPLAAHPSGAAACPTCHRPY